MQSSEICYFSWEMKDLNELHDKYSSILSYTTLVLAVTTCIIGFLGNGIVIWVTKSIMKEYPPKIWFMNLAIADFVCLLCLPLSAVAELNEKWPFGSTVCKIYNLLSIANMYASIFIITALNIDRALAVAKPIWHHKFFSQRIRCFICASIWLVTILASVPAIIFGGEIQSGGKTECSLFDIEEVELHHKDPTAQINQSFHMSFEIFDTFKGYLYKCTSGQCCAMEKALAVWNQMVFSTKCLVIPLLVIGYFIPLCVILTSNIIIAVNVSKSEKVKSPRLYRIIVTVFMVHLLTWTPLVIAQIVLLVAIQNMNITLVFKLIMFLPLLNIISFISNSLNPIMYVLVGSQVRKGLVDFASKVKSSLSFSS